MDYQVVLGTTTFRLYLQAVTSTRVASAADAAPTYRIYAEGNDTPLLTGSFNGTVVNSQTGFYNTAALEITTANGFAAGGRYTVRCNYVITSNFPLIQRLLVT